MTKVEKHILKESKKKYKKECKKYKSLCEYSRKLYNECNYILRQCLTNKLENLDSKIKPFIREFTYNDKTYFTIDEFVMSKLMYQISDNYKVLPSQTSQQVIKLLYKNWKSFYKSLKSPKSKNPKPPKYKKEWNIVIFTNQQARFKNGYIKFPKKTNLKSIKTKINGKLQQVRILPRKLYLVIEVVYNEENDLQINLENKRLSIDLGLNNLVTAIDEQGNSFIIKGKIVKSINQWYNKEKARLQSNLPRKQYTSRKLERLSLKRKCKIENYFHHVSRFITNYCKENKISEVIIGYNQGWKQNINIGKVNNQKFVQIPYLMLINQLNYKLAEIGVKLTIIKESYTSKVDALAKESIESHENYKGKRVKRGLFQSSVGKLINADINGALNIFRKVVENGNQFIDFLLDRGCVYQPEVVEIFKSTIPQRKLIKT